MKYDLRNFLGGEEYVYKLEGETHNIPTLDYGRVLDPIKYNGKIFKVASDLELFLDIQYIYEEECDRCLKPTTNVYSTILSGKLMTNKGKYDDEDELEDVILYENDELNLEEYIWSQVVSSLPMKTLCSNDCKGLCPTCGVDLNTQSCDCMGNTIDPRLEKLKELFPKK